MKRNNLWIIGVLTAGVTVFSLSAIFGRPDWRYHRHPGHYWRYDDECDHERRSDSLHRGRYHEQPAPASDTQ